MLENILPATGLSSKRIPPLALCFVAANSAKVAGLPRLKREVDEKVHDVLMPTSPALSHCMHSFDARRNVRTGCNRYCCIRRSWYYY